MSNFGLRGYSIPANSIRGDRLIQVIHPLG